MPGRKEKETLSIENKIKSLNKDLNRIGEANSFYIFEERTLAGITDITKIIEEMARQTGQTYEETKSTDC